MPPELLPILEQILANQAQTKDILAKLLDRTETPAHSPSEWLSINEVSRLTGLSTKTIRRVIRKGALRASVIASDARRPTWRIARADLDTFMNSNTVGAPAPTASQKPKGRYKSRHFADL